MQRTDRKLRRTTKAAIAVADDCDRQSHEGEQASVTWLTRWIVREDEFFDVTKIGTLWRAVLKGFRADAVTLSFVHNADMVAKKARCKTAMCHCSMSVEV